jgi:hypothetical protein
MLQVEVKLDKLVIVDHYRGEAILETHFSEGQNHGILRQKTRFNDPEKLSEEIIKEIRNEVRKKNTPAVGDDILDSTVNVRFTGDEDELLKKMRFFFSKITNHIKGIGMTGTPMKYLDAVGKLKGMELKF